MTKKADEADRKKKRVVLGEGYLWFLGQDSVAVSELPHGCGSLIALKGDGTDSFRKIRLIAELL